MKLGEKLYEGYEMATIDWESATSRVEGRAFANAHMCHPKFGDKRGVIVTSRLIPLDNAPALVLKKALEYYLTDNHSQLPPWARYVDGQKKTVVDFLTKVKKPSKKKII